jgi:hypothetical protein
MRTVGWSETAHSSSISLGISAPSSSVSGRSRGGTETSSAGCGRGMAMDASVVFVVRRGGVAARPCGGVTASCATVAPGSSPLSRRIASAWALTLTHIPIIALYPLLVRASTREKLVCGRTPSEARRRTWEKSRTAAIYSRWRDARRWALGAQALCSPG